MERGMIYFPNTLSEEEIKKNPIVYGDPILVDELDGYINIKVFKREEIEKLCEETKFSEYEIIIAFRRSQNSPKREKQRECKQFCVNGLR